MTVSDAQAVELLTEMVSIPSLCGQEEQLGLRLQSVLPEIGYDVQRDEVGNFFATVRPEGSPTVVVLGHMDTVPGSISVRHEHGSLYGRGAVDAKGPLATGFVAAARAAERTDARLTVIGAVQEEGPSVGARHLAQSPAPDYLIIAEPSGWDSIVLGYKGGQRFTVRFKCPCLHSANPEPTATEQVVQMWNSLVAWCQSYRPVEGSGHFDRLTPTLISMNTASDGMYDIVTMEVGMRLPPGISIDSVRAGVMSVTEAATVEFYPGENAIRTRKDTPLVAGFLRAIRSQKGQPRFKVKTGTSDMNIVGPVWQCSMVSYGPGDARLDHTPNEHIEIDEYLTAIRVLTDVLVEI